MENQILNAAETLLVPDASSDDAEISVQKMTRYNLPSSFGLPS